MIYRCMLKTCPHGSEPCELTKSEINTLIGHSTTCPIGEDDPFYPVDENYEFFCLIVGSREYRDYKEFCSIVDKLLVNHLKENINIVSGGAEGTDAMAERYANEKHYHLIVMPVDWDEGKNTGFIKNDKMHKYIASKESRGVIAFWDGKSKGTAHSLTLYKKYKNPIRVYLYKEKKYMAMDFEIC